MGRKILWTPERVTLNDVSDAAALFPGDGDNIRIARDWFAFCRLNRDGAGGSLRPRSLLTKWYIVQQLRKRVARSTIKGRLEVIKQMPSDPAQESRVIDRLRAVAVMNFFGKESQVHKSQKPNLASVSLLLPLFPPAQKARDKEYQALWWALLTTGARPVHIRLAQMTCQDGVLSTRWAGGRKSGDNAMARPLCYAYNWVAGPPSNMIKNHLEDSKKIGTQNKKSKKWNTAGCVNVWLKKWMEHHHPGAAPMTSTFPRVHLDNVLRLRVHQGTMSVHEFESLMDHSLKTSDEHYCTTMMQ